MLRTISIKARILFLIFLLVISTLLASGAFVIGLNGLADMGKTETMSAMREGYERTLKFGVQSMATKVGDAIALGEEINKALQQLDQAVQHNASASEQVAATSETLSAQAVDLQEIVGFFKVSALETGKQTRDTNMTSSYKIPALES